MRLKDIKNRASCTSRSDRRACRWDRLNTSFRFRRIQPTQKRLLLPRRSAPGWGAKQSEDSAHNLARRRERTERARVTGPPAEQSLQTPLCFLFEVLLQPRSTRALLEAA